MKFKSDVPQDRIADILAVQGVQETGQIPNISVHILQLPPGAIESVYVHSFEQQPEVEFAELDQIVAPSSITPNDPYYPNQWALPDISLPTAWSTTSGSSSVVIAILDTGVNAVADLPSTKFVPGCDTYDDPNCLNVTTNIPDVSGHGTETAGAAAAVGNNGIGVASPCWGCSVMPVRVTDSTGNAWVSAVATGLTWASNHGAKIAYVGFALDSSPTVMSAAQTFYNNAGVVVMPAGNTGYETNPASAYAIVVSGVDSNNLFDPVSSYGSDVDLAAPFTDYTAGPTSGTYGQVSGTSFSAALVAGTAGLVLSKNSCLSAAQVTSILQTTATPLGAAVYYGSGLVNASAAVTLAGTTACSGTKTNTTTTLASSLNPSNYGQSVTFTATVSPSTATGTVTFFDGSTTLGSSALSSGRAAFSTSSLSAGTHSIEATYNGDASDNASTSNTVSQTVNSPDTTPPTVSISSPANGATLSGTISITGSASDNSGVTPTVTVTAGGVTVCTVSVSPFSCSWNTTTVANGSYTITATAKDGSNNTSSTSVGITVSNFAVDSTPPTAGFTSPAAGSSFKKGSLIPVSISASDNVGVVRVEFYADGTLTNTWTAAPYSTSWNAPNKPGSHTLQAKAYDAAGNVGSTTITVNLTLK